MGVSIAVKFDNTSNCFYPGQLIQGKVTLQNDTEIIAKGLILTFFGDAEVYWTESEVRYGTHPSIHQRSRDNPRHQQRSINRHVQREYRNQETFLCQEVVLFGQSDDDADDEQIKLTPGTRQYPFLYRLPLMGLPSTVTEFPFGFIKYTLDVRLKRQLFRYDRIEKELIVNGILDLNLIPASLQPFGFNKRKDFGWICCPDGYITADLRLEKIGHVPTEPIRFIVSILNMTRDVIITSMNATFWLNVDFYTFDRKKTISNDIKSIQFTPTSDFRTLAEWSDSFQVPDSLHPTILEGCRIIRINYKLDVLIKLSRGGKFCLSAPIVIGSGPCLFQASHLATSSVENAEENHSNVNMDPESVKVNESYQLHSNCKQTVEYNPALNPFLDDFVPEENYN